MTTYTKLRDGSWGLRCQGTLAPGASVTVRKKDGTTKTETVGRVLWTGDGITLATIAAGESRPSRGRYSRTSSRSSHPRTGCACGSREGMVQDSDCQSCRFDELDM